MALSYPVQEELYLLGAIAAPVTLTTSYAGNVSVPEHVEHYAQMTFCIEYTTGAGGAGNSVQIQVEGSPDLLSNDSVTPLYYIETASSVSGGTITHTAALHTLVGAASATQYNVFFYVPPAFKTIRVSAKETVVGGSAGTLILRAITSGK